MVAQQPIPRDTFVCTYDGERLTNRDAEARLKAYHAARQAHALLVRGAMHACCCVCVLQVARMVLPSNSSALRINVDATHTGNIARFINHRCALGVVYHVCIWCCALQVCMLCATNTTCV